MDASLPLWPLLVLLGVLAIFALPAVLPGLLTIILGPFVVRRGQRVPRTLRVEPTRAEELSPEVRDFVHAAVRQFAAEGFEVAAGVAHGAVTVNGKLWDCAAPAAIVLESGGVITDLQGRPVFPFDLARYQGAKVPFLAAAPNAHETLLREITSYC